jgi:vacuolar-type H+-ATPase subunit F/Vma7
MENTKTNPVHDYSLTNKIAVIADRSTVAGFKLAGVQIVRTLEGASQPGELIKTLDDVLLDPEIKFIFVAEPLVEAYGLDNFEKHRKKLSGEVIITLIPDIRGSKSKIGEGRLWKLIHRAIGLRKNQ